MKLLEILKNIYISVVFCHSALTYDMQIPVTYFFRDKDALVYLIVQGSRGRGNKETNSY